MCRLMAVMPNQLGRGDILDILQDMEGIKTGHGFGFTYVVGGKFISKKTSISLPEILKKKSKDDFFGDCFNHDSWVLFHSRKASLDCGRACWKNSHPFEGKEYSLIHNGRFDQFELVRELLDKDVKIRSETDSEIALHLLEKIGIKKFQLLVKNAGVFMALDRHSNLNIFKTNFTSDLRIAQIDKRTKNKKIFFVSELPYNCCFDHEEMDEGYILLNSKGEIVRTVNNTKKEVKVITVNNFNSSPYYGNPMMNNVPSVVRDICNKGINERTTISEYRRYMDDYMDAQ